MKRVSNRTFLGGAILGLLLVHTAVAWGQVTGCLPPPEGLVAWWRGESTTLDSAGTNNAVNVGGVHFADAQSGRGFVFSGAGDDYVELPQNLFPMPTSGEGSAPFSFELWFKTVNSGVILGQQDAPPFDPPTNGNVPALYVGTNGTLFASLFWNGGTQLQSAGPVNDGRFHHVAVTFDGNTQALYLDGQWIASTPFAQQGYADAYWYQLGTGWSDDWLESPGGWFPFTGIIDEASFYNRALLPAEITAVFNAASAGKCGAAGGPVLLHRYNFNSAIGSRIVADSVGGANGLLFFFGSTPPYTNGAPDGSAFTGTGELSLNGDNGYVVLPPGLVSSLSNLTAEAWISWRGPSSTSVWQRILDFGLSDAATGTNASGIGTNYLILTPSRGGSENFGFEETTLNPFGSVPDPNALILGGPGPLPIGRKVFLAVTYDPIAGQSSLYLDGSLVGTASGAYNTLDKITDRNNFLGRSQWQRDPFFNGVYDELRLWEGILGPQEIANHYASGPDQPFATPRPWLQAFRTGDRLTVSWSTNYSDGFRLEVATDLRSPSWAVVTNVPDTFNTSYRLSLPAIAGPAYFRLKK